MFRSRIDHFQEIEGYDSSTISVPLSRQYYRFRLARQTIHEYKPDQLRVAVQIGPINLATIPFSPAHTMDNELRGIYKRLIHKHNLPQIGLVRQLADYVKREIIPYLPPLELGRDREELLEKWFKHCSYSNKRKQQLIQKYDAYIQKYGLNPTDEVNDCKMFIKEEFYPEKKHARMIISRSDEFKAIVGPYIHAFDEELFHGHFEKNFVKGKDSTWKVERMKQINSDYPLVLETDYSSFEGSQSLLIQNAVELQVFRHYFQNYPEILRFIEAAYDPLYYESRPPHGQRWPLKFDIHSKHFKMHIVGNRKSGEMWTSSGNGLLNLVIMGFLAERNGVRWDGIVEGDDGFFGVSNANIQPQHYDALGFTIKLLYETDPNKLSFCGLRFSKDGQKVVDPENLNRIGWAVKRRLFNSSKKKRLALLKAKAMSLLAEAPHCPVTSVLARELMCRIKVKADFSEIDPWYRDWLANEKFEPEIPIADSTRECFEDLFGITVLEQLKLEESFRKDPFSNFSQLICTDGGYMDSYEEGLRRRVATCE